MDFNIDLGRVILMVPALLFAVIIHELAHGYIAYKLGDPTAKFAGRLTFNPIPHIDPIGSLLVPGLLLLFNSPILFGWAKPVPINPMNFKKFGYRKGMAITASAGPMSNLIFAAIFGIIFQILSNQQLLMTLAGVFGISVVKSVIVPLLLFLKFAVSINVVLAIFNILPIPPLDGGRVLMSVVPPHIEQKLEPLEQYGFFIVILLLFIGVLNYIILPPYIFLVSLFLGS